jgi:hypothetical protein
MIRAGTGARLAPEREDVALDAFKVDHPHIVITRIAGGFAGHEKSGRSVLNSSPG